MRSVLTVVKVTPGAIAVGGWCDVHALPHIVSGRLYVLEEAGPICIAQMLYCDGDSHG